MVKESSAITFESVSLEDWERGGSYFRYQEFNIFYRTNYASKPTLLLIHGFPTSSWDFSCLWEALEGQFNLLAIDLLGFGLSDKPFKHRYTTQEQADLVELLLRNQGIKQCHILAHDYGDTVTQEMMARYEDDENVNANSLKILSVCFLNGGLFPESHSHTPLQGILAGRWGNIARFFITRKRVHKALNALFGDKHKPTSSEMDILWQLISNKRGELLSHKLLQYIKERQQFRERWVGVLQKTAIAMRLINGPVDPVSGINMVENYRKNIINPDIVLLDGVGHFPHMEVPHQVVKAYLDFYQRVAP
jgi:pimeloyl-ACP methyl ester carboxylesterase